MLKYFREMSIRNKLLSSSSVSLFAIVVVWILIAKIINVSDHTFTEAKNMLEVVDAASNTATSVQRISEPAKAVLHDWNVLNAKKRFETNHQDYEAKIQIFKNLLKDETNPKVTQNIKIMEEGVKEILDMSNKVFLLADKKVTMEGEGKILVGVQGVMEMANALMVAIDEVGFDVFRAMKDTEILLKKRTTTLFGESLKNNKQFSFYSVTVLLISVILSTVVSLFIAKSVSEPIKSLLRGFKAVSEGDISYKKEIESYGETAVMVKGFYAMLEGLRKADADRVQFEATLNEHNKEIRLILNNIGQGF